MRLPMLLVILLGLGVRAAGDCPAAPVRPDSVMLIGEKERPQRVVVTVGDTLDEPAPAATSPMLGMLHGVLADLSGAELGQFLATPMPRTKLVDARGNIERIGVAHLIGRSGVKRVELLWGNEGEFLAQEMDEGPGGASPRVARLDPDRFRAVFLDWPRYRGKFDALVHEADHADARPAPGAAPGVGSELPKPYSQAPFYLDTETLRDRFVRGGKSQLPPLKRILSEEAMYVRLPRGYDPRRPAGLLVWISAQLNGRLPDVFVNALDELNIIGVGIRNIGNDREVTDRLQLPLDAVWTVSRRYHVDPRRVYVTGVSGGGRVASRLIVCFPDYFTGGVPIVGLDAYFNIPVGNGRFLPGRYRRPDGKLWTLSKKRRMGAITGDRDGNSVGITQAAEQMIADGLPVRVFQYRDFGHQMPSFSQFSDVLKWVDEPFQAERAREEEAARTALAKYTEKFGAAPPADDKQRAELVKVTAAGPWTDAAWEAATLLGMGAAPAGATPATEPGGRP